MSSDNVDEAIGSLIPLSQMPPGAIGQKEDSALEWYTPEPGDERRGVSLNAAAVGVLARHLRAVEWARSRERSYHGYLALSMRRHWLGRQCYGRHQRFGNQKGMVE